MAKLEEYASLEGKGSVFVTNKCICNKEELQNAIDSLRGNGKHFFFRGLSEAKYKLYTSGQREYIQNEYEKLDILYPDFMRFLYDKVSSNRDLLEYHKVAHIQENASYFFTYLQHYGAPTPYIDFTTDILVALFFCFYHSQHIPSDKKIDNFCSVYYIAQSDIDYLVDKYNRLNDMPNNQQHRQTDNKFSKADLSLNTLQGLETFYMDWHRQQGDFATKRFVYRMPNRYMLVQKGALIYNADGTKPLENIDDFKQKIGCLNIHKSLCDYIKVAYLKNDVTEEKLFPDESKIAKQAYLEFKQKL